MATGIALLEFMIIVGVVLIAVLAAFDVMAARPNRDSYGIYMPKGPALSVPHAKQRS